MLRPDHSRPPQRLTSLSQRLAAEFSPNDRCHLRSVLALAPTRTLTALTHDSFAGHAILTIVREPEKSRGRKIPLAQMLNPR